MIRNYVDKTISKQSIDYINITMHLNLYNYVLRSMQV